MAKGDKHYVWEKATLDDVNNKVGNTTDTGGSETGGTIFGKLNKIINSVLKIGSADDAQISSTTTGSIFAKLNYLVWQVKNYLPNISGWASNIPNIREWTSSTHASVGNSADTGATATTGTVMGKLNKSIDTSSPKVICKGMMGTIFTFSISNKAYSNIETEITSESINAGDGLYFNVIPIPLGTWDININIGGKKISTSINITNIGELHHFSYSSYELIGEYKTAGAHSFTVPSGVTGVFISAAGGGGGGEGGINSGYGGGGGAAILYKRYTVSPGSKLGITVGAGGKAGQALGTPAESTNGGATVIGRLVTLAGGRRGEEYGYAGGSGGGKGGDRQKAGGNGIYGSGGSGGYTASGYTGGGGGGGSLGNGGRGGIYPNAAGDGREGGGGGGAAHGKRSGSGGDGVVRIYKGVQVNT